MIWVLFIVVLVLVVGAFAALVTARVGYDPMSEPTMTQADPGLGEGFEARDVATVRFDTALRGYRMDQVDAVLDRLQDRISELEGRLAPPEAVATAATSETSATAATSETSATPVTPTDAATPASPAPGFPAAQPAQGEAGAAR